MKDDRVYLGHIRDAIHDIDQYTEGGRDSFMGDRMQQDAVIRKFEIIGEAVKHLSEETNATTSGHSVETYRRNARPIDS